MTFRRLLSAAVVFAVAASAFAALSPQHEAWGKSAVKFLMTDEETAAWKNVKTDDEAKAFIDLFWARRDPSPATPANEFKDTIEARIRYADENFGGPHRQAGSLTDRGMVLVVFGEPARMARSGQQQTGLPGASGDIEGGARYTWLYEGETARKLFGSVRAEIKFVDQNGIGTFTLERGGIDIPRWRKAANTAAITQPQLTKAPEVTTVPMAGSQVTAPKVTSVTTTTTTVAPSTSLTTPALAQAVADAKAAAKNPFAGAAFLSHGEFVTPEGEYYVPVLLYVPKGSPAAATQDVTFFGVIEDADGKAVHAFEQPAKLTESKGDFFVDATLTGLPAGKHRGWFGIAANGKTVALVPAELTLAGTLDQSAAAISQLILGNNVYALAEAQKLTDPFAFAGRKIVPKADKVFSASTDELWYFFEMRNPGLAADTNAPKVQLKIDMIGKLADGSTAKKAAPLSEANVLDLGLPGRYAVGSAFPLETFKPGDYSMTIKVIDTVSKASYTLTDTFKVVQ